MIRQIKGIISNNSLYQEYLGKKHGKYLSTTIKRLDVAAAQMAHLFSLNKNLTVKNKICLEIGGGWIFSHALVMHLLGAKKILITDITLLAKPEYIKKAIHSSSISAIRDILSPYEDHEIVRERLNNLTSIKKFDLQELEKLGIEYRVPVFWDSESLQLNFDFIFSNVVLEYFTENSLVKLFENLKNILNSSGDMLHTVHLEDHDSAHPFNYLKNDLDFYKKEKYKSHSNRIRFSTYDTIFSKSGFNYNYLYRWYRKDVDLPENIDKELNHKDENDLRTSHFCVHMKLE